MQGGPTALEKNATEILDHLFVQVKKKKKKARKKKWRKNKNIPRYEDKFFFIGFGCKIKKKAKKAHTHRKIMQKIRKTVPLLLRPRLFAIRSVLQTPESIAELRCAP
ncbi:MAG: hypothetical protein Pars93KO_28600 [Parasphingorhabdus sp.]